MQYSIYLSLLFFVFTKVYSADTELTKNGDFSNGLTNWSITENGSSTVQPTTLGIEATVQGQTTNPWDIQLVQRAIPFEKGAIYRLKVVAESAINNHFIAGFTTDGEPYTSHFSKEITLKAGEENSATFDYTMTAASENILLSFDFGDSEIGSIIINSASLLKLTETKNWIMVWHDEFDVDGPVDETKWTHAVGGDGFGNQEAQYYSNSTDNSFVSNGNLVIKAKKETVGNNDYTSAKLISHKKGDWKYGKFEIRAQLPNGKGMWPAIWMLPTTEKYGAWPKSGEIDIMENVGFEPDVIHWNTHTEAFNHSIGTNKGDKNSFSEPYNKFHVYTIEWNEDKIEFFVDGVKYFQFDKESDSYKEWPFDQEFYLILNSAVGGTWGGLEGIDNNIFPQEMRVDYVRVYELAEKKSSYQLTAAAETGGTVTNTHHNGLVNSNEKVTLEAIPHTDYQFVRWVGTFDAISNPVTFDMNLPVTMTAKFKKIGELIINGDFSEGTSDWQLNTGEKTNMIATDAGLSIITNTTATNPWDVQVSQAPLSFKAGCDYQLNVTLESTVNTQFLIGIGINQTPWSSYATADVILKANQEKVTTIDFSVVNNNNNSRVYFDLGKASVGNLLVKKVSLTNTCLLTDITTPKTLETTVYPNPTTDYVNLSKPTSWQLFSALGKLVKEGNGNSVSLEESESGIYFLKTDSMIKKVMKK